MKEQEKTKEAKFNEVLERNAQLFGVTVEQLSSKNWRKKVYKARNITHRELKDLGYSYSEIGKLTNRHRKTIKGNVQSDIEFQEGEEKRKRDSIFAEMTIKVVAKHYGVSVEEMLSKSRKKQLVQPRNTAQFIIFEETDFIYQQITNAVGRKNHSTAMHAVSAVAKRLEFDKDLKERVGSLKAEIQQLTIGTLKYASLSL